MASLSDNARVAPLLLLPLGLLWGLVAPGIWPTIYGDLRVGDEVLVTTSAGRLGEAWVADVEKAAP